MHNVSPSFAQALDRVDMPVGDTGSGLLLVSSLATANSILEPYHLLLLERAKKIGADAVYFKNNADNRAPVAQVYLFDFSTGRQVDSIPELHRKVWSSTDVRIYFIITKSDLIVYNSSKPVIIKDGELAVQPFETLNLISDAKERFDEYSGRKFDNGSFWEIHKSQFSYNTTAYEKLISELRNARQKFNKQIVLDQKVANKLLIVSILIKYLEERVDIDADGNETRVFSKDIFNKAEFGFSANYVAAIENGILHANKYLLAILHFLSNHFGGHIFNILEDEVSKIESADIQPLADFLSGRIDGHQYVLWSQYSFNYLPIELISNIYEEFLENTKDNGVAYTPSFLVNFLIDETMPIHRPQRDYRILDPACGSGIFLVSAYKRLVDWWRVEKFHELGYWVKPNGSNLHELQQLLVQSVYGVDIATEAVSLAVFSLSLTLCDIFSPKVIWEDLKFSNLSGNIIAEDFFTWIIQAKNNQFDIIIGNPPFIEYPNSYVKQHGIMTMVDIDVTIPKNQSAILFTVLSEKLLAPKGLLCFILPSGPLLYNSSAKSINFRQRFFERYSIPQIIDFTYLSNTLFRNKGNEKNVAVAAVFIENNATKYDYIYHVIAKKLKVMVQRHYFEFDHYDFHLVKHREAVFDPLIWKSNLLGGGRLILLLNKLRALPTLKDYFSKQLGKTVAISEGYIKGKPDEEVTDEDIITGRYKLAPYLSGALTFESTDFTEHGIANTHPLVGNYFQRRRKEVNFRPPLLVIKKNIGSQTIPVVFSQVTLAYKKEFIGIHATDESLLLAIRETFANSNLYRFILSATSGRSGISRSVRTVLKKDILALPYLGRNQQYELGYLEQILVDDTLEYWLDFLAKENNIRALQPATLPDLQAYQQVLCEVLNSLFSSDSDLGRYVTIELTANSGFGVSIIQYVHHVNDAPHSTVAPTIIDALAVEKLVRDTLNATTRINRIIKLYEADRIILIKPLELRYWLRSIAIRDADEIVKDLYNAGY
ncbi:N-6 DNA methylase [Hymenobacter setariae]|uniref:site-specific DNA-methyltransferase (adenine-specific) n=1 Tax=Hymenobacter setariae TaxID=2594794 RepID=A0A558BJR8_9BACT|nr:N-6 DNA methylase [Hymenobacter setariae]TVT36754.1 N-6 DNA methylase [Hymenobacter setariae]